MQALPLDHLSILSTDLEKSAAWYGQLLPRLGFEQTRPEIWRNADGLHLQFGQSRPETRPYERYAAGLNHLGFTAPNPGFVEDLAQQMHAWGHEARLQRFGNGVLTLFMPDPDGLRIELSWYPPGVPPVD